MTTIEPQWGLTEDGKALVNINQIVYVADNEDGLAVIHYVDGSQSTSTVSTRSFYNTIAENSQWTKQDLLTRYKAGFETSGRFDKEKWRVDRYKTRDGELHLVVDNADKYTEVSDWGTDMIEYYRGEILPQLGDLPIEVWLGDVKIKEATE